MDKQRLKALQRAMRKHLLMEIRAMEHKLRFGRIDDVERASLAYRIGLYRSQLHNPA